VGLADNVGRPQKEEQADRDEASQPYYYGAGGDKHSSGSITNLVGRGSNTTVGG
jgi:hypothetical protein